MTKDVTNQEPRALKVFHKQILPYVSILSTSPTYQWTY